MTKTELENEVARLTLENETLKTQLSQTHGDYAVIDNKVYKVLATHPAKAIDEQVKKRYVEEYRTVAVLERFDG